MKTKQGPPSEQQSSGLGPPALESTRATAQPFAFEELGEWLLNMRLAQGVSQRELAARVGVLPQAMSRMERERYRGVSFERLSRVVEALGISLQLIATVDSVENWKEQAQE